MTKKKRLITTTGEYDFCIMVLTQEEFDERYELSTEMINKLAAKQVVTYLSNTDRAMTPEELKSLVF